MPKKFKLIAVGGTFDRLHFGHQTFLKKAFAISEQVLLGVTGDNFVKKKRLKREILSYQKRRSDVVKFLKKNNFFERTVFYKLDDVFGPALDKNLALEGILVTEKTLPGAKIINEERKRLGLSPLEIIIAPLVKKRGGEIISSTKIRQSLFLPKALRPLLKKPFGKLITTQLAQKIIKKEKPVLIITVGDVVTRSFNELGIPLNLAVVDFKIKRKKVIKNLEELGFKKETPDLIVKNPPGTISKTLLNVVAKTMQQFSNGNNEPFIIKVLGEEDLAVLPVILFAPQNSAIFYGQPHFAPSTPSISLRTSSLRASRGKPQEGIVYLLVNEKLKKRTRQLLSQFE